MVSPGLRPLVAIVDDDVAVRESLETLIRTDGYRVASFESADGFRREFRRDVPACVVLDLMLPDASGVDLQQEIARSGVRVPIVFLTGHGDIPTSVRAIKAGALEFLTKPVDHTDLLDAVRHGVSSQAAGRGPSRAAPNELVGTSAALRSVLEQVDLVAETDVTVLITGETGTGKELLARALHERSARRHAPLVKVNCGAIPDSLFESEFFGHVKGAFTGALRDKPGRFELAEAGTLVLDEIGEVPLSVQPKLLRVLQERELERVGDTRSRRVDVRIIAMTNRDLEAEVRAARFRPDLFYRLNVFPIQNPPLRERRGDIPRLAEHFVRGAARRLNRDVPALTEDVKSQLAAHDWPGNIRELQSAIERAVILSRGGPLRLDAPGFAGPAPATAGFPLLLSRSQIQQHQKEAIVAALARSGGKVSGANGAAKLLGLKPTTLYSRMLSLGLRRFARDHPPS